MVILGIIALSACKPGNVKPDFEKQIVGKWEVKTCYHWYHDLTDEIWSSEESFTLPDTNYIGYDAIEFNADKTSRWHRSDLYVQQGMYDDPYATFNWQIVDDTLIIASELKYAIKSSTKTILSSRNMPTTEVNSMAITTGSKYTATRSNAPNS